MTATALPLTISEAAQTCDNWSGPGGAVNTDRSLTNHIHRLRNHVMATGHPTHVRRPYSTLGKAKRIAVYERDGFTCCACRLQFEPMTERWRAPAIADFRDHRGRRKLCILEIDHIYPRVLGGGNELANLRALCNRCNARKGGRV